RSQASSLRKCLSVEVQILPIRPGPSGGPPRNRQSFENQTLARLEPQIDQGFLRTTIRAGPDRRQPLRPDRTWSFLRAHSRDPKLDAVGVVSILPGAVEDTKAEVIFRAGGASMTIRLAACANMRGPSSGESRKQIP